MNPFVSWLHLSMLLHAIAFSQLRMECFSKYPAEGMKL